MADDLPPPPPQTQVPAPAPAPQPPADPTCHNPEHARVRDSDPPPDTAPLPKLVRFWVWKYAGTLVMERQEDGEYVMSLGRVATAALMAQAMWRWGMVGGDIPQSMLQTLWILLGYLLGTKGLGIATQFLPQRADADAAPNRRPE